MKQTFTLLLALLFSVTTIATPQPDYSKLKATHPRLILKSGDIEAVRQKIATDQPLFLMHHVIEERTNNFIPMGTIERKMVGKRLLGRCRAVLERVCMCSYMYLLSGDEMYARRAEKEMLSAANYTDWNPKHFLDVGEMTTALAIGYDWLYDWLSPESRKVIEDAIIEKGLLASDNKRWWSRSHNNWNQVCNGGLVMGALAVYERDPELAQKVIKDALAGNPNAQASYGPDGVYPEGYGYWEYGTNYEVVLIEALRTALGSSFDLEKAPGFLESARFMNYMVTPTGRTFNFSDCGNTEDIINPLLYWFALETGDMSLVWSDRKTICEKERVRGIGRLTPLAMLFAARCNLNDIKPIEGDFWYGKGEQPLFIYRKGFEKTTDSYLAAKGGSPSSSHAHMDGGTFIYEWGGVRWASDLGNQDYHSLESKGVRLWGKSQTSGRWTVFRLNNFSHNNITVNEQIYQYGGKVELIDVYNKSNKHGGKFDTSEMFIDLESAYRTIYIDKNDKVTCIDELKAKPIECNVRWNMVTTAEVKILDDKTISLKQDGKEVILRAVTPSNVKAYIMSNAPKTSYDCPNKGTCRVGFAYKMNAGSKSTIKVELIPQK